MAMTQEFSPKGIMNVHQILIIEIFKVFEYTIYFKIAIFQELLNIYRALAWNNK